LLLADLQVQHLAADCHLTIQLKQLELIMTYLLFRLVFDNVLFLVCHQQKL